MFNPRNDYDYNYNNYPRGGSRQGQAGVFGSRYNYQAMPRGMTNAQTGGLIGKVMALLAFSFMFAALGAFVGTYLVLGVGTYLLVVIAGFVALIALNIFIQQPGINLVLLYLFTFLEGMGLGPLISTYAALNLTSLLAEAFLMMAIVAVSLGLYAWTTKRDFSRLGDYLFVGVICSWLG